jgi:hypothetical protein
MPSKGLCVKGLVPGWPYWEVLWGSVGSSYIFGGLVSKRIVRPQFLSVSFCFLSDEVNSLAFFHTRTMMCTFTRGQKHGPHGLEPSE